ncbi:hypothetical protein [Lentilactobacillus kisonensis]|uniref:Uncharacterized protein n=1 Tax=Lentilactobacillus kisonensis DSM 19906 = JCM 15041 TaxID=1423766 RepID=A0A0R1NRN6_9LACO|nr:hypothetical protein [Lentilactobacillus kisonensis]KRL23005.1 hypothetical protein FC98_GL001036 [Lentilactobacillus kisonensis DSM 19906 = JCM 15041]
MFRNPSKEWSAVLVIALIGAFFIIKERPWVPQGLKSGDSVLAYSIKHDNHHEIKADVMVAGINEANQNGTVDDSANRVFVLKNKKHGNYVFKYDNHYVYLVEIVDLSNNLNWVHATEVKPGSDGETYTQGLSRDSINNMSKFAVEDAAYNINDLTSGFGMDFNTMP